MLIGPFFHGVRRGKLPVIIAEAPVQSDKRYAAVFQNKEIQAENKSIAEKTASILKKQNALYLTWREDWHTQNPSTSVKEKSQDAMFHEETLVPIEEPENTMVMDEGLQSYTHHFLDGLLHVDERFKGKFPELVIKLDHLQMQFISMSQHLVKDAVQFVVGVEKITSEEARNLYVNWLSWKIQSSLTNNALHYGLEWMEDLKSKSWDQICAKIKEDLSKEPEGNTWWNQWKFTGGGTKQRILEFTMNHPEMCVSTTNLIENALEKMKDQPELQSDFEEFSNVMTRNPDMSSKFIACGLLLHKTDSNSVTQLMQQMEVRPSCIFAVMNCVATLMKTIEGDKKSEQTMNVLTEQVIHMGEHKPDLIKKMLQIFNQAMENNPELKGVAEATIKEVDQTITAQPEIFKAILNVAPVIIHYPKVIQLAIETGKAAVFVLKVSSKAEEIKDRFHLHEEMDFEELEGGNPKRLDRDTLMFADTVLEALEVASEGINPHYEMPITVEEKTLMRKISDITSDITGASWLSTRKTVTKEMMDFPNTIGTAAGGRIGNALCDAAVAYQGGNLEIGSVREIAASRGMGALKCILSALHSSAKKVGYETVRGGVSQALMKVAPGAAEYVPNYQTAHTAHLFTSAVLSSKSGEEAFGKVLMTANNAVVTMTGAMVGKEIVSQMDMDRPVLSAVIAGVIAAVFIRTFTITPNKTRPLNRSADKTN